MEPINLMKYICVTEIIHLNFGKSEMLLFGIQRGKLSWDTLGNFAVSPECFRLRWHFVFIVRPVSDFTVPIPSDSPGSIQLKWCQFVYVSWSSFMFFFSA